MGPFYVKHADRVRLHQWPRHNRCKSIPWVTQWVTHRISYCLTQLSIQWPLSHVPSRTHPNSFVGYKWYQYHSKYNAWIHKFFIRALYCKQSIRFSYITIITCIKWSTPLDNQQCETLTWARLTALLGITYPDLDVDKHKIFEIILHSVLKDWVH